jgi:hypothetical protein
MAAANWATRRISGDISYLSPTRLKKESKIAGPHKNIGIFKKKDKKRKAIAMPIPPPLGVGTWWELLSQGISQSPNLGPRRDTQNAPRLLNKKDMNRDIYNDIITTHA